jgi:hypothetical protein
VQALVLGFRALVAQALVLGFRALVAQALVLVLGRLHRSLMERL